MSLVSFKQLMADAEAGSYAVGYFESWNLESLLAVADAAEATRSPVILGWSGISLPHPDRAVRDRFSHYAALGLDVCRQIAVPACLLFNESPDLEWVFASVDLGFSLTMYADEELSTQELVEPVRRVVAYAHAAGVAVEAEMASPPGLGTHLAAVPTDLHLTDVRAAIDYVAATGIDALAVNIGQVHLHGRSQVSLDLGRLEALYRAVPVPLVLHGATSIRREDLARVAGLGVRKINVGSVIKRTYFETLRRACNAAGDDYNPYEVVGSGFTADVTVPARLAMQAVVEDMMRLFGSAGKA